MSYVLHCWSFPSPRSFEHAVEVFKALPRSGRTQNRAFLELAHQLIARYPRFDAANRNDPSSVWSNGIPDGITESAAYDVHIRSDKVEEVQPFVVETATTGGLVAFDEQRREVYLPGGVTLTTDGRRVGRHLGLATPGPLSATLVERTLTDALLPVLAADGFEIDRSFGGLSRAHASGTQALRYQIFESSPQLVAFDVEIVIVLNAVKKTMEPLLKIATQGREKHVATASGSLAKASRFYRMEDAPVAMQDDASLRFELTSVEALRSLGIALRWLVIDHLVPKLEDWVDVEGVAMTLFNTGHDWMRSVGSLVRNTERGVTSALIGGRLLDTRRCGGAVTGVLLAAFARAPMLQDVIDAAYRDAADHTGPALATEKAKLDLCMESLRSGGFVT